MASGTLMAADYLSVTKFVSRPDRIEIHAESRQSTASCPVCGVRARRVQSRYTRRLGDLPWHGVAVELIVRLRRFFCDAEDCRRRIFVEPIPEVAARYARKTLRLALAIELIGFALGGRPGARTAAELGVRVGRDSLLRAVRRAPVEQSPEPRVVGIDDWAIHRGQTYGTIIIDLERHRRLDLLPDRKAETLAAWLAEHREIEIVSRDRAGAYADGTRQGAPTAVQVADRWHLIKNAGDALERVIAAEPKTLAEIARRLERKRRDAHPADLETLPKPQSVPTRANEKKIERRMRRFARYKRVVELFGLGMSKRAIAREVGLDIKTVRKFLSSDGFPERAPRRTRSRADPYVDYLRRRWAEGCRNATQLWREVKAQGYRGGVARVRRVVQPWRDGSGLGRWKKDAIAGAEPPKRVAAPSPRRGKWVLIRDDEDLDDDEREFRDELLAASPTIARAAELTRMFNEMIRTRDSSQLAPWIAAANGSGVAPIASFAAGLEPDRASVEAALTYEWSNGQTEGQVNRLKAIKRSMFGRANFDLLRKRVLSSR
jgi:transposase